MAVSDAVVVGALLVGEVWLTSQQVMALDVIELELADPRQEHLEKVILIAGLETVIQRGEAKAYPAMAEA